LCASVTERNLISATSTSNIFLVDADIPGTIKMRFRELADRES